MAAPADTFYVEVQPHNPPKTVPSSVPRPKPKKAHARPSSSSNLSNGVEWAHDNSRPPNEETWLSTPTLDASIDVGRIPHIINKIYFQKDGQFQGEIPPNATTREFMAHFSLRSAHQSWIAFNPGYKLRYFNLLSARRYLHGHFNPAFLRTFDCIQAFAGKSDFFRAALLYREGGFHTDWKMECLELNLLDRIANATDFFAAIDLGNNPAKFAQQQSQACAANSFVGSVARHASLARYLEIVMIHVQQSYYPTKGGALFLTGPGAFGSAVRAVNKDFGNDTVSWPIHKENHYYWRGKEIVLAKCKWCGYGQGWANGNNYNELVKNRTYYCEDSASIFQEPFCRPWF